tara:strand:+ start:3906 stop:4070 length:165 start_codon:yes stop_codon:yes gene_type:complete
MKTFNQFIQEKISKENGKWVLRSKRTGKVLGTHDSEQDAIDQEIAIQISKKERK